MRLRLLTFITTICLCSFLNSEEIYAQEYAFFNRFRNYAALESGRILFQPAMILSEKRVRSDLSLSRRFGMKELSSVNAFFVFPSGKISVSGAVSSFGGKTYRENSFGLIAASPVNRYISVNSELKLNSVFIPGYSSLSEYVLVPGICVSNSKFSFSFRVPGYLYTGRIKTEIARKGFQITASAILNRRMLLSVGRIVQEGLPGLSSIDLLTTLKDIIAFGITSSPETSEYAFKIAVRLSHTSLEFGLTRHSEIGSTPHASVSFVF